MVALMKRVVPLVSLVSLAGLLAACIPERVLLREREARFHSICISRGGDYEQCRASVIEEREACLKRWDALSLEERRRINLQHAKARPPEIRACNALGWL